MPLAKDHPWLVFDLQLTAFPPSFWSRLGAVASMAKQIAAMPLLPENFEQIHKLLLVKSTLASAAIEDNFTAEQEISRLEAGEPVAESYADAEIDNLLVLHRSAMQTKHNWQPTLAWLCATNRKILDQAASDKKIIPGQIRQHNIHVGPYRGPDYDLCRELVEQLCRFLAEHPVWKQIAHEHGKYHAAIIKAVIAHLYVAWIHPFGDGNGRGARLTEFTILTGAGLPPAVGCCLSRHYHQSRPEYYWQMQDSSRIRPRHGCAESPASFIYYAVSGLHDLLVKHIKRELLDAQQKMFFQSLLDIKFNSSRKPQQRQRKLIIEIYSINREVKQTEIPALSAEIALLYHDLDDKTLTRDLNKMTEEGWLQKTGKGTYLSNRQGILQKFKSPQAIWPPATES